MSLDYDTILQLDRYCKKWERWSEIPYMQAFIAIYQNPTLYKGFARPQQELKERDTDILDDPLLQGALHVSQRESPLPLPYAPDDKPTSPPPQTPPPTPPPVPPLPMSLPHTQNGTSCSEISQKCYHCKKCQSSRDWFMFTCPSL
jgi:hypothetical protein